MRGPVVGVVATFASVGLALSPTARAQTMVTQHADGRIVPGIATCVGPLAPSDPGGVRIVGSAPSVPLTWQVWSTSSQTAPALVFTRTDKTVDAVVPPSGNLLYYGCVAGAQAPDRFDLALSSGVGGTPPDPADVQQQHEVGTIRLGARTCGGRLAPSGAEGVQIFGYTNGVAPLTWRVVSVDPAGVEALEFSQRATYVDHTVPPRPGLEYFACVGRGPATKESFDLSLNSTPLQ